MKRRLLLSLALFGMCWSESGAQIYSQNVLGYHTVQTCTNGLFVIANSLNNGGNELNRILPLPDWADGTTLFKFDLATQYYRDALSFIAGYGWLTATGDPTLHPGEGAFILTLSNSQPASIPITFVGEVPQGRMCQSLPGGNNLVMWSPPFGRGLEALQPWDGDTVYFYDCGPRPDYSIYTYFEGIGWLNSIDPNPNGRPIPPGVSAWVQLSGAARNTCWPCLVCAAAPSASTSGVPLSNPEKNGSTFTFTFSSQTNATYQVQVATSVPLANWQNLGSPITANESSTLVVDTNAVSPLKLYRVLQPQ